MNILEISWQAVVLQIVAFLVLIWAVRKYLFGPIGGILEARQSEVQNTLNQVYRDREAMETSRREYEARLAGIEAEARDRLHGDLLGQVLGVGAVPHAGVDECVDELELVERDIGGAGRGRQLDDVGGFAGVFVRRHRRPRRDFRRRGTSSSNPACPAPRARPRTTCRSPVGS